MSRINIQASDTPEHPTCSWEHIFKSGNTFSKYSGHVTTPGGRNYNRIGPKMFLNHFYYQGNAIYEVSEHLDNFEIFRDFCRIFDIVSEVHIGQSINLSEQVQDLSRINIQASDTPEHRTCSWEHIFKSGNTFSMYSGHVTTPWGS